jgi:membrane associated rhomboid family serine protease
MQMADIYVTLALIIAISAISLTAFNRPQLFADFAFEVRAIRRRGEWIRLLTSAFLHADISHLAFNLLTLYFFAETLEQAYGHLDVLIVFTISVAGGSLFSLARNWNKLDYTAIGASGGVSGIVYSHIFMLEGGDIYILLLPIPIPDKVFAVLYIFASYYMLRRNRDNIGHDAHLGGALAGTLYAFIAIPWLIETEYLTLLAMLSPFIAIYVYEQLSKRPVQ